MNRFAVMFAHGPYRACIVEEASSRKRAEREACNIVEAGANVWEGFRSSPCPTGDLPDEFLETDVFYEGYEVLGVFDTSKYPATFEFLGALDVADRAA